MEDSHCPGPVIGKSLGPACQPWYVKTRFKKIRNSAYICWFWLTSTLDTLIIEHQWNLKLEHFWQSQKKRLELKLDIKWILFNTFLFFMRTDIRFPFVTFITTPRVLNTHKGFEAARDIFQDNVYRHLQTVDLKHFYAYKKKYRRLGGSWACRRLKIHQTIWSYKEKAYVGFSVSAPVVTTDAPRKNRLYSTFLGSKPLRRSQLESLCWHTIRTWSSISVTQTKYFGMVNIKGSIGSSYWAQKLGENKAIVWIKNFTGFSLFIHSGFLSFSKILTDAWKCYIPLKLHW